MWGAGSVIRDDSWCTSQRQLFWYLVQHGIHDIEVYKERGRYVVRKGKMLYSTDIRSLQGMRMKDWKDYLLRRTA